MLQSWVFMEQRQERWDCVLSSNSERDFIEKQDVRAFLKKKKKTLLQLLSGNDHDKCPSRVTQKLH